jgi:hypothetical protein
MHEHLSNAIGGSDECPLMGLCSDAGNVPTIWRAPTDHARVLQAAKKQPFMAQISFHNCHIPFIGTPSERAKCNSTESCKPPLAGASE